MQQRSAPKMDSSLKGKRIEVLLEYFEPDNTRFFVWTKGKMVGLPLNLGKRKRDATAKNKNDMAIIKWDGKYCFEGSADTTQQQLLKTKWNKHVKGAGGLYYQRSNPLVYCLEQILSSIFLVYYQCRPIYSLSFDPINKLCCIPMIDPHIPTVTVAYSK